MNEASFGVHALVRHCGNQTDLAFSSSGRGVQDPAAAQKTTPQAGHAQPTARLIQKHQSGGVEFSNRLELLTSIPGVGTRTACLLLTELGDIGRFSSARRLVAYAGLTPERHESGSSVHKRSRITRMGSRHLRKILYMPSLSGLRYNPSLQVFFKRLVDRDKPKKSALVACMAKLLKIVFGVLTHRKPYDASFAGA